MARHTDPEQELSDKVERLYVEYAAAHGAAPRCPPGFPQEPGAAERERLVEAERQVFEHVAWYGRLPAKLTDEQRWLLDRWIALRPLTEDRSPCKAIAHRYFGEAVERELKQSAGGRASSKVIPELQEYVDGLVARDPDAMPATLWGRIPDSDREQIYRYHDEEKGWIVELRNSGRNITKATFPAYVRRARENRKKLRAER